MALAPKFSVGDRVQVVGGDILIGTVVEIRDPDLYVVETRNFRSTYNRIQLRLVSRSYTVTISVDPMPGTGLAAAIHQGFGEENLKAYLSARMPAGSPVTIEEVKRS